MDPRAPTSPTFAALVRWMDQRWPPSVRRSVGWTNGGQTGADARPTGRVGALDGPSTPTFPALVRWMDHRTATSPTFPALVRWMDQRRPKRSRRRTYGPHWSVGWTNGARRGAG